jgi:hypothetical protein
MKNINAEFTSTFKKSEGYLERFKCKFVRTIYGFPLRKLTVPLENRLFPGKLALSRKTDRPIGKPATWKTASQPGKPTSPLENWLSPGKKSFRCPLKRLFGRPTRVNNRCLWYPERINRNLHTISPWW